ncbi:uncharacterized protein LOC105354674 isoform X2 [Oryzias latipes]|uniref:uncharacterized protein LOC105354674 isoform X2 n=1 Tax=Oryzias latipes TaxID=8090 RepID=UPI0009D9A679|nr:uncharacterized protein LOC105354674 isoform X2 [Oryzias latipes]
MRTSEARAVLLPLALPHQHQHLLILSAQQEDAAVFLSPDSNALTSRHLPDKFETVQLDLVGSTSSHTGPTSLQSRASGPARLCPRHRRCVPGTRRSQLPPWGPACGSTLTRQNNPLGMEPYQKASMRKIRRNSSSVLQHLFYRGVHGGGRDTPMPALPRDDKMVQSIASLIRAKSKLLLLENPDTVEIYKLDEPTVGSERPGKGHFYLPAITTKASSLSSIRGALSQSCPYLYDKRRGSLSSVASHRTGDHSGKQQSHLKAKKEAKKSNVTVTMTYLGQRHRGSNSEVTRDELKVLQQVTGGENICVFKGLITRGEQFQFVSQRHIGYPFSASIYINGIMVTRISSCCEYRYAPGFQQGRKSFFRLTWLAGGTPCYRCTSLRNKSSSFQQLNNGTKENVILPLEKKTGNGAVDSCPSSPLFIPAKPVKKSARRTKKHIKESIGASTDSEDLAVAGTKETSERKRRKGQSNQRGSKDKAAGCKEGDGGQDRKGSEGSTVTETFGEKTRHRKDSKPAGNAAVPLTDEAYKNPGHLQPTRIKKLTDSMNGKLVTVIEKKGGHIDPLPDEEAPTKENKEKEAEGKNRDGERLRDFYEECVEMSAALKRGPNKHRLKASILERCRLQKSLSSSPKAQSSDVELSAESDNPVQADGEREEEEDTARHSEKKEEPVKEKDLEAQLDAMMSVLKTSDEVDQLVLRNTGLTDDLLLSLATVLKGSPSQVKMLNLNLNTIGPYGAHILLEVLRVKPHIRGLHLFGNRLRDHGLLTLLTGIAELQEQTAATAASIHQALLFPSEQGVMLQLPTGWSSFEVFTLLELDIGGNGLNSEGVRVIASYMRSHSHLQYLGLAQTSSADLAAWKELFESLKGNGALAHIILDENNLGDPGVRLLADMLKENPSLRQVDLDRNDISDVGGNDIMGALLCRTHSPLSHLSLEENSISAGLMSRIQEQVQDSCRG